MWLLDESPFLLLLASSFFNLRSLGNHTEVFEELVGFIRFLGQKVTDFVINFFSNIIEARKARFPFENVNVDLCIAVKLIDCGNFSLGKTGILSQGGSVQLITIDIAF